MPSGSPYSPKATHTCSAHTLERCPECGYEDTRDAFEGWTEGVWQVMCRECEAIHPDQSNHDDDCGACYEDELRDA